jgi:hypothetical protein
MPDDQRALFDTREDWQGMTPERARALFDAYAAFPGTMQEFCARRGIALASFRLTMDRVFGREWAQLREQRKRERASNADRGFGFERAVKLWLAQRWYWVYHSPASQGPIDVVAMKVGGPGIRAVQCKRDCVLPPTQWNALWTLATGNGAIPVLAGRPAEQRTGVVFWRLLGQKTEARGAQPMVPFEV